MNLVAPLQHIHITSGVRAGSIKWASKVGTKQAAVCGAHWVAALMSGCQLELALQQRSRRERL